MQPRIYTYKVTFEEIPDWYWGSHKEEKYGEPYLGSPKTHKWKWEFYTPHLQICEVFPYTDEGWTQARKIEDSCILPDLNNPLCLNEHVGGLMSLESARKGGIVSHEKRDNLGRSIRAKKLHEEKDNLGRSVNAVKAGVAVHREKDDLGRSVHAMGTIRKTHEEKDYLGRSIVSVRGATACHEKKDDLGRSVQGVKNGARLHEEKDELGRSLHMLKLHKEKDELGRSVLAMKLHEDKDGLGRSVNAVKGAKTANAKKWKDPQHPELGEHHFHTLRGIQRQNGYPHGKENRVRVG